MTERQQADITNQQIESACKQRKAHRLHQEQWIGKEWRDDQRGHHHGECDGFALPAQRRWRRSDWIGERLGQALFHCQDLRPNRPAGRTNRTIAMMTKITVFDASGKNTLVRPSITPRPKPVTMAPRIDPMPPITTTAKTTMISSEPICGDTLQIGAAITPANAASA